MQGPKVIVDCDPGHDDVVALMLAGRLADLVGITTVSGNASVESTTRNALIAAQVFGLDVPVHAGSNEPLVAPKRHAEFIHGESGLDGPVLPPLEREHTSEDAVEYLLETTRANPGLWIVATGPLTNIARALRLRPEFARDIAGLSVMGGSLSFGNLTAVAEFNIWCDPEAAAIVFSSGASIRMVGLNVTHEVLVTREHIDAMASIGSSAGTFVAQLLNFFCSTYAEAFFGRHEAPLHDPCAVLAVTHPELFEWVERHVAVELYGEFTRGMTVVDQRELVSPRESTASVATGVDVDAFFDIVVGTLATYQ